MRWMMWQENVGKAQFKEGVSSFVSNMDKLTPQQRHAKAAIKREQNDACISSAEREQARRSANMAAIRSKDTKPEMIVRHWLWSHGYRYRLYVRSVPGKLGERMAGDSNDDDSPPPAGRRGRGKWVRGTDPLTHFSVSPL